MNLEFLKKIAELKKETGKMQKDSENPFFKSKYFDINQLLEHLEPICEKKGLLILQPIIGNEVHSQIIDLETGDRVESSISIPSLQDPQKIGSAITYYRRYSLQSLLGLQAEDDDANKASGNTSTQKPASKKTSTSSKDDDKPWLNLTDKDGNHTAIFNKLIERAQEGDVSVKELRNHFKVSTEAVKLLSAHGVV